MKILIDGVNIFLSSYIIYLFTGKPISGSGAGLRPIGQDPNFVADLRESFNIAVPVLSDEVQWVEIISERALVISINLILMFLQVIRWLTKEIDEKFLKWYKKRIIASISKYPF